MKKPFSFFALVIVCILFSSMYYIKTHSKIDSPEATLVKSFDNSGAKVVNSEIYFWARIDNKHKSFEDLTLLVENITDGLGVVKNSTYVKNSVKNDMIDKLEIKGLTDKDQLVNVSVRLDKKNGQTAESTISGTITRDLSNDWLDESGKKLSAVLKKYRISAELNTCIVGSYEGILSDDKLNDVAKEILRGAEAKKIDGIRDNMLISVSAYSPNISDSIRVNGKKVNLNLAIRYNTYEKRTYIWLATPVITKEY